MERPPPPPPPRRAAPAAPMTATFADRRASAPAAQGPNAGNDPGFAVAPRAEPPADGTRLAQEMLSLIEYVDGYVRSTWQLSDADVQRVADILARGDRLPADAERGLRDARERIMTDQRRLASAADGPSSTSAAMAAAASAKAAKLDRLLEMHDDALRGDAEQRRRLDEHLQVRQREALCTLHDVFARLAVATPDNFANLQEMLDRALAVELPHAGPQQELLRRGSRQLLEAAKEHVARCKEVEKRRTAEEQQHIEDSLSRQEATLKVRETLRRLAVCTESTYESARDEAETTLQRELLSTGPQQETFRVGLTGLLESAQQWTERRKQEDRLRQEEEQQFLHGLLRQQEATLAMRRALQRLAGATPDSYGRLREQLQLAMKTDLPDSGPQQDILRKASAQLLEATAHFVVEAAEEEQRHQDLERGHLRQFEARLTLRCAVQRVALVQPMGLDVAKADLQQVLETEVPHCGGDPDVLRIGASRVLQAAEKHQDVWRQEEEARREADKRILRQQEATFRVQQAMLRLSGASLDNLADLRTDLEQVLQAELSEVGAEREQLKSSAASVLSAAEGHVRQTREELQRCCEEESKFMTRLLREQDAVAAIRFAAFRALGAQLDAFEERRKDLESVLQENLQDAGKRGDGLSDCARRLLKGAEEHNGRVRAEEEKRKEEERLRLEAAREQAKSVLQHESEMRDQAATRGAEAARKAEAAGRAEVAAACVRRALAALGDVQTEEACLAAVCELDGVLAAHLPQMVEELQRTALSSAADHAKAAVRRYTEDLGRLSDRQAVRRAIEDVAAKKLQAAADLRFKEAAELSDKESTLVEKLAALPRVHVSQTTMAAQVAAAAGMCKPVLA